MNVVYVLFLCRVNVDFQSQSVCPVGVMNMTFDPDKLPPNPLFVVNITEVSPLNVTWSNRYISKHLWASDEMFES